MNRAKQ